MVKISEFSVNQQCEVVLVVLSASARKTRAGKPFLVLELFDGVDKITGNYWDWSGKAIPDNNAVLNVSAQVTEYNGQKQLNISGLSTNSTVDVSAFAVSSGVNINTVYESALGLISEVCDITLKVLAESILAELKDRWLTVPGAKSVHHAYVGGTLIHSYSVAMKAGAMADVTPGASKDLCIIGGLLHDVGKLFGYQLSGVVIDLTEEGMLFEHIFMGAEFVGNYVDNHIEKFIDDTKLNEKIEILRHIILSHHGVLEHGSPVTPGCLEAYIVHHADLLDAAADQLLTASKKSTNKFTERIYMLNNRPHLTMRYVADVMDEEPIV